MVKSALSQVGRSAGRRFLCDSAKAREAALISRKMKAPVSLRIDNNIGEYFRVDRQDLPALVKAAAGPIADWDEFSSILVKDESWSRRWHKIELRDR